MPRSRSALLFEFVEIQETRTTLRMSTLVHDAIDKARPKEKGCNRSCSLLVIYPRKSA
jgi:hypothetical protein